MLHQKINSEETPREIIRNAFNNKSDRQELMQVLKLYPYTFGISAPYPDSGYLRGTWDDVVHMFALSSVGDNPKIFLSDEEFKEICSYLGR